MEQPSLHRTHRSGPARSFVEGLKRIPENSDWKAPLRNIPYEHYLDPESRPGAREGFKAQLKRIPAKSKVLPLAWRVAAAAAGLGLVSVLWSPNDPVIEIEPIAHVERMPAAPVPLAQVALTTVPSALPERAIRFAPSTSPVPLEVSPDPMTSRFAEPLATLPWSADLIQSAEPVLAEERSASMRDNAALRARFSQTGEHLLARSGGKWGWSIGPANDPVRFRVYANKSQWVALRRKAGR